MTPDYTARIAPLPADPMREMSVLQTQVLQAAMGRATTGERVKASLISRGNSGLIECGVYLQQGVVNGAIITLVYQADRVAVRVIPGARLRVWMQWGSLVAGLLIAGLAAALLPSSLGGARLLVGLTPGALIGIGGVLVAAKLPPNAASREMMERLHSVLRNDLGAVDIRRA